MRHPVDFNVLLATRLGMASLGLSEQIRRMTAQTKNLLNDQLRHVLRQEGLVISGVKAELQNRIIQRTTFVLQEN